MRPDRFSQYLRIARKLALEKSIGDDHHVTVGGAEDASQGGLRARELPEIGGGEGHAGLLGILAGRDGGVDVTVGAHDLERLGLGTPIEEVRTRRRFHLEALVVIGDPHQALGAGVRNGA